MDMGHVTRVAVAAVDPVYRQGLERVLSSAGIDVVALCASVSQLLSADVHARDPVMIVLELGRELSRISADVTVLRQWYPSSKLVIVADPHGESMFVQVLRSGVDGLLVKPIGCEAMVAALELVALGERIYPAQFIRGLSDDPAPPTSPEDDRLLFEQLSARELDVIQQLSSGSPNKVIARQFGITEATVKVHVKAILRKLGVRNRTQAALMARRHGLYLGVGSDTGLWAAKPMPTADQLAFPEACE